MRHFVLFLLVLLQGISFVMAKENDPVAAFEKAQKEYVCSWAALASYDDAFSKFARSELQTRGLSVTKYNQINDTVDAKCYLITQPAHEKNPAVTVFAVTGTESMRDIKADLRFAKVPFHQAKDRDDKASGQASVPMVHKGFDDYASLTLNTVLPEGGTIGNKLFQLSHQQSKNHLIITGHSLGGAVATLIAARLSDMGIPANQLEVVSFGAPAVGNQAFVDEYRNKFHLDRVVVKGDIVNSILQNIHPGYKQFPDKTLWYQSNSVDRFQHDMVGYVDAALRNYYDCKAALPALAAKHSMFQWNPSIETAVYVAPFTFSLDEQLSDDQVYMEHALKDSLKGRFQHVTFAPPTVNLFDWSSAAKRTNAQYVIVDTFTGRMIRDKKFEFVMAAQEDIYTSQGNLILSHAAVTNTAAMTPIEALLYNQIKLEKDREDLLLNVNNIQKIASLRCDFLICFY